MLVLVRGVGERVVIILRDGREVWVTVCRVRGNRVRVGIEAPRDVIIDREELVFDQTQAEQTEVPT